MRAMVSSDICCHPIVCTADEVKLTDKRKEKILGDATDVSPIEDTR